MPALILSAARTIVRDMTDEPYCSGPSSSCAAESDNSVSDPRAEVFKSFTKELADEKGRSGDFALYNTVERLGKEIISEKRKIYKGVSVNVDFYSGFVYSMLDIPVELFTPIFAIARITGWSAHRIEELINTDKIIRPAYKSVSKDNIYLPLSDR